jgi:hypothetical protein
MYISIVLDAKFKAPRFRYAKRLKNSLLATQPAALVESWIEFIETRTAFFAIGCSIAACIETDSVLHQKLISATPLSAPG